MKTNTLLLLSSFLILSLSGYAQLKVASVKGTVIEIDSTFDAHPDSAMVALLSPYKTKIAQEMTTVIGRSNSTMLSQSPQGLLSNLGADVMLQAAQKIDTTTDVAMVNIHGFRSALNKGDISIGDVYQLLPFENEMVIISIEGKYLKEMFIQWANSDMQAVSKNCSIEMANKQLIKSFINGNEIVDNQIYKVATLDYLADGNSSFATLLKATNKEITGIKFRDIMLAYIRLQTSNGVDVQSSIDNRIVITQ